MTISLVIPFVDTWEITKRCLEKVNENSNPDTEVWVIDNGSEGSYAVETLDTLARFERKGGQINHVHYKVNAENTGVLPTFKQALELTTSDIICFIHSDVLLQEKDWDKRVVEAFEANPQLGLVGLFGAVGVGDNGGRVRSQSNMLGVEWGKCDCHDAAWKHHSEHMEALSPATILDGVGMFFSRKALQSLDDSDMFADWRAIHHFYDRIMPLKLIDKGFKVATLGIGFDHWSGATANSSEIYNQTGRKWLELHGGFDESRPVDQQIYNIAEEQFFDEFRHRIPCTVDSNWNYNWQGIA